MHRVLHWTAQVHFIQPFTNCHKPPAPKSDHLKHSAVHQEKLEEREQLQSTGNANGLQTRPGRSSPSSGSSIFPHTCCLGDFTSHRGHGSGTALCFTLRFSIVLPTLCLPLPRVWRSLSRSSNCLAGSGSSGVAHTAAPAPQHQHRSCTQSSTLLQAAPGGTRSSGAVGIRAALWLEGIWILSHCA